VFQDLQVCRRQRGISAAVIEKPFNVNGGDLVVDVLVDPVCRNESLELAGRGNRRIDVGYFEGGLNDSQKPGGIVPDVKESITLKEI
jgi:hypothetical protein